ncbi:MAG: hypothetical protein Q4E67_00535 [Planctomycetia bacterium]|nr:hypothetical protein [Planctomycetia bacterium]
MLTRKVFERIRKRLAKHENVLRIASRTGVNVEWISAIADGWIPEFRKRGRPAKNHLFSIPPYERLPKEEKNQEWRRCPECGGMVQMPCRKCAMEKLPPQKREKSLFQTSRPVTFALELSPECYERYLKIHEQKVREELERNGLEYHWQEGNEDE